MRIAEQDREQVVALAWHHVLDAGRDQRWGARPEALADELRRMGPELPPAVREALVVLLARAADRPAAAVAPGGPEGHPARRGQRSYAGVARAGS